MVWFTVLLVLGYRCSILELSGFELWLGNLSFSLYENLGWDYHAIAILMGVFG